MVVGVTQDEVMKALNNMKRAKFVFMPGRSTTNAIFALRMLMEKYREGQKQLDCVFIDLEKVYDSTKRGTVALHARVIDTGSGSVLSPFLFSVSMDKLIDGLSKGATWFIMFDNDIVVCSESIGEVEDLERWRHALQRCGMKVSRRKTEYHCVNEKEGDGRVKMQGKEIEKVNGFKYLGSAVDCEGSRNAQVKRRVQTGWIRWRKVTGSEGEKL
ncbi:uncharacterized protein LOC125046003 [Penaeus chinensis]|uniref:uncharacterized protein LOC125046003 n=1 Tax=Penaeus chinensis TaxID=139456 RepID=UPI001FB77063|nr:uncharacterized protein LOC125046003 [Penaeus chinensis]